MFVPINGYLYELGDTREPAHAHDLYITSWGRVPLHVHHISGETSYDVGHRHRYAGTTAPAPSGMPHTHQYFVYTSVDDGHIHEIRGVTGPAIPLPNGGHFHEFRGVTSRNGSTPHTHAYQGRTSR